MKLLKTIPWTELEEDTSGGTLSTEWNTYVRLVGQLLADGHENRWVLIVGDELVGIWDTEQEAESKRSESYPLTPVLVRQILPREPIYETPRVFFRPPRLNSGARKVPTLPQPADGTPEVEIALALTHYRRIAEQLLADGYGGHWIAINGNEVLGIYDSRDEALDSANAVAHAKSVFVKQIRADRANSSGAFLPRLQCPH